MASSVTQPGDVLADRSFTIVADMAVHGAKLEIPALTQEEKTTYTARG